MRGLRILASALVILVLAAGASAGRPEGPRLDGLFAALKQAPNADEARIVEAAIWQLWTVTGEAETDGLMARGIVALQTGDFTQALAAFDRLVAKAPDFPEGWNKRATVHYLMGNFDSSVADIGKTLELEPRHFGALSGLGLIYLAVGNEGAAAKAFEMALSVHPHLPAAAKFIETIRKKRDGSAI